MKFCRNRASRFTVVHYNTTNILWLFYMYLLRRYGTRGLITRALHITLKLIVDHRLSCVRVAGFESIKPPYGVPRGPNSGILRPRQKKISEHQLNFSNHHSTTQLIVQLCCVLKNVYCTVAIKCTKAFIHWSIQDNIFLHLDYFFLNSREIVVVRTTKRGPSGEGQQSEE